MPSGACIRKRGSSRIQLPTMHPQPELTDGLSATACFQVSAQPQSQISSCQTIMGWQLQCHLSMHPPAAQGFGQCLLPSFPILPSKPSGTAEAPSADSLAMVPLTPDDAHASNLRRSSREHKKPRPYYAASQAEPPDKPSTSKGLLRGFLK